MTAISDDGGAIWRAGGPMVGAGPIQPTLAQRKDGTVVAYCRDSGPAPGRVQRAESKDEGQTWSITKDTDFPNPSSSLEVIVLEDGTWVMIHNDTVDGRHSLAVSQSDDEGNSWRWTRHLERGKRDESSFAYPSFIQTADGMLHATYTYKNGPGGKAIKHSTFNVEWIKAGD